MSKKSTRPSVPFAAAVTLAQEHPGVSVIERAGWIKVAGPHGDMGPRIYIQRKHEVRQVDLSMMGVPEGALPSDGLNGNVQAHLDLSSPDWEAYLIAALELVANGPKATTSRTKGGKPSLASLAAPVAQDTSAPAGA